jgi:hypothetical protein
VNSPTDEPWRRIGQRRDCEPHRGPELLFLARVALWSACLTVLLLPALVAVALGSAVWFRARHDLVRMSRGEVDPEGMGQTASARGLAGAAVTGTLVQLVGGALLFAALYSAVF